MGSMKRSVLLLIVIIIASLILVSCTSGSTEGQPSSTGEQASSTVDQTSSTGNQSDQGVDLQLTSYVIADGGTYFYLKPITVTVHFDKEPSVQEKLKVTLSLLASSTLATSTTTIPLPEGTKVLNVKVGDSEATVNFSKEIAISPGVGGEGERLALCSIPLVAKQFGIEKVYILIEGQKPSEENGYIDFWGHVGLYEQPLTADGCKVGH